MTNPLSLVPHHIRAWGYLVLILLGPFMIYAEVKGWVGAAEMALYAAYSTLLGGTALSHVAPADQ